MILLNIIHTRWFAEAGLSCEVFSLDAAKDRSSKFIRNFSRLRYAQGLNRVAALSAENLVGIEATRTICRVSMATKIQGKDRA